MRAHVLILDGAFDLGLGAVLDTLETANALAGPRRGHPPFQITRVGVRRRVRSAQGFEIPVEDARTMVTTRRPDVAIVIALGAKTPETLAEALERRDVHDAGELLRAWQRRGTRVTAACTGTFVLAQAGLLDGERATTTWWLASMLRDRFREVRVDESRMVVESGRVVTAGAALGHLDLALWIVRNHSPELARITARHLLYDEHPSQAAFIIPDHVAHTDSVVERFERWARENMTSFSMSDAARAAGASERTLERRVRHALGKSPVSFVQDLRVEQAVHLLSTSDRSLDDIADLVGYRNGVTLRTLIRKKRGRGVRELRESRHGNEKRTPSIT